MYNKKHDDREVIGLYLGDRKCLRLTNVQLVKLKEKLQSVSEEQLTLCTQFINTGDKHHPKEIVSKLVESEDKWQNRIFMLGICTPEIYCSLRHVWARLPKNLRGSQLDNAQKSELV